MSYMVMRSEMDSPNEKELLRRYTQGDQDAFREVLDRHKEGVYAFLTGLLNHPDLVEDAFQETFMQLFVSRQTFDVSRPLRPWLFTIAANKARDALRRARRREVVPLGSMCDSDDYSHDDILDLLHYDAWMPYDNLDRQETAASVRRAISRMPGKFREILLLAYFQKLPYADIAAILDIPLGTVKSRLHTAVGYFAEYWRERQTRQKTG